MAKSKKKIADIGKDISSIDEAEVGDIFYYSRVFPQLGIYEVVEYKLSKIYDDYFVGSNLDTKQRSIFVDKDINKCIHFRRSVALDIVNNAKKTNKPVNLTTDTSDEEWSDIK